MFVEPLYSQLLSGETPGSVNCTVGWRAGVRGSCCAGLDVCYSQRSLVSQILSPERCFLLSAYPAEDGSILYSPLFFEARLQTSNLENLETALRPFSRRR